MEEGTQVFGNFVHGLFLNSDQSQYQSILFGVFTVFMDITAFVNNKRKGDFISYADISENAHVFLSFKQLCFGVCIIQTYVNSCLSHRFTSLQYTPLPGQGSFLLFHTLFQGSFAIFNTLFRTSFSFLPASNGIGLELFSGIRHYSKC